MEIKGRRAIVTGAGRGLGRALAVVLADAGAELILCARSSEALDHVANCIVARGQPRPECVLLDLADRGSVDAAARRILQRPVPSDVLINNGAKWLAGTLEENSADEIAETVASQLTGTMLLTRALLPMLKQCTHADVLTIVSTSGLPNARLGEASPAFLAAKYGQAGFASALRQSFAGTAVRSTAIFPPDIEDLQPEDLAWADVQRQSLVRGVSNRDVVDAALFVLSRPSHVAVADLVLSAGGAA